MIPLSLPQMIVTTPEKWDVITRKGGDVAIASLVKLLIIDEVGLLSLLILRRRIAGGGYVSLSSGGE